MQTVPRVKSCPHCRSIEDILFPYGAYPVHVVAHQEIGALRQVVMWVCRRCGHVELRQAA